MPTIFQERQQAEAQRLYDDRKHLLRKLATIGYVPDYDLRKKLIAIRDELNNRVEYQKEEFRRDGVT